jgi:hypothetical protein
LNRFLYSAFVKHPLSATLAAALVF